MRSLREKLAQANLKLGRQYPEPTLVYQQRGTSAGTAWLEKMKFVSTRCYYWKTSRTLSTRWCLMSWRIY